MVGCDRSRMSTTPCAFHFQTRRRAVRSSLSFAPLIAQVSGAAAHGGMSVVDVDVLVDVIVVVLVDCAAAVPTPKTHTLALSTAIDRASQRADGRPMRSMAASD